jgi:hypothetical protein
MMRAVVSVLACLFFSGCARKQHQTAEHLRHSPMESMAELLLATTPSAALRVGSRQSRTMPAQRRASTPALQVSDDILGKVERSGLISYAVNSGLIDTIEENRLLSLIEKNGLLSTAEELLPVIEEQGLLSLLEDVLDNPPPLDAYGTYLLLPAPLYLLLESQGVVPTIPLVLAVLVTLLTTAAGVALKAGGKVLDTIQKA